MAEHKIAIISDTHSLLRPEVKKSLEECEAIFHAGDIAKKETYDVLKDIARLYAVRGNADKEWARFLPVELAFTLYGFRFHMVHNRRQIRSDLSGIDIVIFGHSHKYEETTRNGICFLNPGSCGPRRFHQPVTYAMMEIDDAAHTYRIEKVDISPILRKGDSERMLTAKDMDKLVASIVRDMNKGHDVETIAARNRVERELVHQVLQLYTTHPGIDVDGILDRMDIWGK